MISAKRILVAVLCAFLGAVSVNAAETKDAVAVINGMRLKKLTKDLELTEEQQKKIAPLYDEEAKATAHVRQDPKISKEERSAKIKEAQQATYTKMKAFLTPQQVEKLNAVLAAAANPKKRK